MAKAYLFGEIEITDPVAYAEYGKLVSDTIAAYGGKVIVRGPDNQPELVEGVSAWMHGTIPQNTSLRGTFAFALQIPGSG